MKIIRAKTGAQIKLSCNEKKRTYTLRTSQGNFKTKPLEEEEFYSAEFWTYRQWIQFIINRKDDYIEVDIYKNRRK